jgi:alpha-glucosidase (family GH31 glycosyl hydrolase)
MLGTWRYAQTWTGDNRTDWKTLRFNVPMGLNLGVSGWTSVGHDVGGFAGPMPDPELLVRWIEHGVGMPRFVIHSWNSGGTVTEPWSHPEVLDEVRALLRLRERLVPYLATLARAAATESEAIVRPLAYDFPAWRPGHREDLVHMLGPALLIAPVVEPGATTRPLRLPPGRWLQLATGRVHDGDAEVVAQAPLGVPAWFLREGHAIPIARGEHEVERAGVPTSELVRGGTPWGEDGGVHWLGLPDRDERLRGRLLWDDGLTRAHERGAMDRYELDVDGEGARVVAHAAASGMGTPVMDLWMPAGDDEVDDVNLLPPWGARWRARPVDMGSEARA